MAEFNTATQYVSSLTGGIKVEVGYRSDVSAASSLALGDLCGTHCMPTTLSYQLAGWIYCVSTSGGIKGCLTGKGPVMRDWSGTTKADADDTAGSYLCFTLDTTSSESTDYYMAFGW